MWKTDGTEAGTLKVKEINNNGSSNVSNMRVFDNKLLFSALDSNNDRELWVTDGTEAGTQLLYDIYAGEKSGNPYDLTVFNNELYFGATDGVFGTELRKINMATLDADYVNYSEVISLQLYPNPVNSMFSLNTSNSIQVETVILYDIQGKQLLNFSDNSISSNSFNIENIPSGIYIVKIKTSQSTISKKVIKSSN